MEEVLPAVPQAHAAQGDEVSFTTIAIAVVALAAFAAVLVWRAQVRDLAR